MTDFTAASATAGYPDLYVGVDIGGTFTDLVIMDASGEVSSEKSATVPNQLEEGVFHSLERVAEARRCTVECLLARCRVFAHGTTQATNALVERSGARTGLITTLGFGDTIFIQRLLGFTAGVPSQLLGFYSHRRSPDPIVPRGLVREVPERVEQAGRVLLPLDEQRARDAITSLLDQQIDALAVCFLWSFRNPGHERRLGEMARELAPDLFVSLSSDVCPVVGEYERTATTVLNAYVALRVVQYLDRLERRLRRQGFRGAFRVLNSVGGVQSADDAAARPVLLLGSGPTGGVSGSLNLAQTLGYQNVITTDMGGTSFDVGLIVEGRPVIAAVTEVGQYHVAEPMVQVRAIGAGGGSLARVVSGMLQVGPQSAGASPGPVCYGRGGEQATVTDADLALGIIDPDTFLGGRMTLDRDAAVAAIDEQIARPLDLDVLEAAAGIRRVVDSQMADALRQVTIGRGHDPREFVLFAYGGAGPTHAADYSAELGLQRIVVPATSMVHSAYGALTSDVLHTAERSVMLRGGGGGRPAWDGIDGATIEREYTRLEQSCLELLERNGITAAHVVLTRTADVRYRRQTHELIVQYIDGDEAPGERLPRLVERFERAYEDTYGRGSAFREAGIEVTTLRVEARGQTVKPRLAVVTGGSRTPRPRTRKVYDPDARVLVQTPIYSWLAISAESSIDGPAVIEHPSTTVVVRRGQRARLDLRRNLVLDLEPNEQ